MKKYLLVLVACLTCMLNSQARTTFWDSSRGKPVTIGIRAGLNVSDYTSDLGNGKSALCGFVGGFNVDLGIVKSLSINTGLYATMMGASWDMGSTHVKDRPWYLRIPAQASYRLNITRAVQWQLNFGPYFGFGVGGKHFYSYPGGKSTATYFGDHCNVFDFGLGLGTGFTIKKFYVGLGYDFGLTDVYDNVDGKNGNFHLSVGFNFL